MCAHFVLFVYSHNHYIVSSDNELGAVSGVCSPFVTKGNAWGARGTRRDIHDLWGIKGVRYVQMKLNCAKLFSAIVPRTWILFFFWLRRGGDTFRGCRGWGSYLRQLRGSFRRDGGGSYLTPGPRSHSWSWCFSTWLVNVVIMRWNVCCGWIWQDFLFGIFVKALELFGDISECLGK